MFKRAPFLPLSAPGMISLGLRRLTRELVLCSVLSFAADLVSLAGASEGVAITLDSSLGELEGFEEECLR